MSLNIQQTENKYLIPLYAKRDLAFIKGEGNYLYDEENKKYLDLTSNYGVNILGYSNQNYKKTLKNQIDKLANVHAGFYSEPRAAFLQKIHKIIPQSHSFICNTGAESTEAAIKFARIASGKQKIISAKQAYHGRTMGALSATAVPKYQKPFQPLLSDFIHIPYNNIKALEEVISTDVAAVILEPIQGEAGVIVPDKDYLKKVKKLCEKYEVILIADEVQSGFRTGYFTACEYFNVTPDILCLSKGLGNGFPVALTAVTDQINQKIIKGTHGTTFGSNPLACAAALSTITEIENLKLLENSQKIGNLLMTELKNLNSPIIREVRGMGLMIAVELKRKAVPYVRKLQEQGILVILGSTILRLLPPLTLTEEEALKALETIKTVLK